MSNKSIVSVYGGKPHFASVMECAEKVDGKYEDLKTFFSNYRNPIGVEIEVEGFKLVRPPTGLLFWNCIEDGSLKVYGREYVSVPISGRLIDYAIKEIADAFTPIKEHLLWSHRTSIHVHVNMSTMKMNHLTALVALYGLFERVFFSMVHPIREANPYCYAATSVDPHDFLSVCEDTKYCAFNLAPLQRFCTVEFRHMHGTDDWRTIRRWIQLIVKLHAFVERLPSENAVSFVKNEIQRGDFQGLFKQIFGASSGLFSEDVIRKSAEKGALWSLVVLQEGFD